MLVECLDVLFKMCQGGGTKSTLVNGIAPRKQITFKESSCTVITFYHRYTFLHSDITSANIALEYTSEII